MTRPVKCPPGFKQHHLYDLITGRSPRKIYLPPNTVWQINELLKAHSVSIRIFPTEPIQEETDERSD